jgi:hypothetical protein
VQDAHYEPGQWKLAVTGKVTSLHFHNRLAKQRQKANELVVEV